MKYRQLDKEELIELEKEFIRFLAVNSIPGPDWAKMKNEDPERANELIDTFSDMVFEKIFDNMEYLEYRLKDDLKIFHCQADKIVMMGLFVEGPSDLDFTQQQPPEEMVKILQNSTANVKLYQAEKTYKKERNIELFEMMKNGCLIAKKEIFEMLVELRGE